VDALRFVVDILLWLLTLAFVLRLLLQLVRANFRDPLADAVVRATNWLVLPLRRVLPPIGKLDTATVVAVLCAATVHMAAMLGLSGGGLGNPGALARGIVIDLIAMVLRIYLVALLLYWLTSTIAAGAHAPGMRLLAQLCEPLLKRVRRVIPPIGQIDFSMLWVSIGICALLILLR
jgi:YggT family protein